MPHNQGMQDSSVSEEASDIALAEANYTDQDRETQAHGPHCLRHLRSC